MFRSHSHPQIHTTALGVTPGDVHFSLGMTPQRTETNEYASQVSILVEESKTRDVPMHDTSAIQEERGSLAHTDEWWNLQHRVEEISNKWMQK